MCVLDSIPLKFNSGMSFFFLFFFEETMNSLLHMIGGNNEMSSLKSYKAQDVGDRGDSPRFEGTHHKP